MKLFKSFGQFLNEKSGDNYSSGCAMLYFDFPQMGKIHEKIDESDLYEEEGDRTYGLENEPHVTLLYGIHDNEIDEIDVFNAIDKFTIEDFKLYNVSTFSNDKFDVLKFDVDGSYLHDMNKSLRGLPHTNDFPDYHPHSTIGYLKPEMGSKYVKEFKDLSFQIKPNKIVYSKPNGQKIIYELKH